MMLITMDKQVPGRPDFGKLNILFIFRNEQGTARMKAADCHPNLFDIDFRYMETLDNWYINWRRPKV